MVNNDDYFSALEEIFNSRKSGNNSKVVTSSSIDTVSKMRGVQTGSRVTGSKNPVRRRNMDTHLPSDNLTRVSPSKNYSAQGTRTQKSNGHLKVDRSSMVVTSAEVIKRKKRNLVIKIGALAIAGVITVVGFVHVFNRLKKGKDVETPLSSSVTLDGGDLIVNVDDGALSKQVSDDKSSELVRHFPLNSENVAKCSDFKNTNFGRYLKDICTKYGQDYDLLVAQFYHESHLEHYDVLPIQYAISDSPVENDNGYNWFNGTGYGMGQLTVNDAVIDARDVSSGQLIELTNNEDNASDPYKNVELAAMIWQDNQFRCFYTLVERYNTAIGIDDCFNYENIKRILNGENVGLSVKDEKFCVNQIMSALGFVTLDCYNLGLGNTDEFTLEGIFDSNGNFLYDKYRENIRNLCTSRDDCGDPDYIDHVLENLESNEFSFYVNKLGGFATFSLCKSPEQCFESFTPVDMVYSFDEQSKTR